MAKIKNYVELTKVSATNYIYTVVVPAGEEIAAHGQFANLGNLSAKVTGTEAFEYTLTEAGAKPDVLIDAVARDTGHSDYSVQHEVVPGGKAARAYRIEEGMTIAINEELVHTGYAAGDKVAVGENGLGFKLAEEGEEAIGVVEGTVFRRNVGKLVYIRFA